MLLTLGCIGENLNSNLNSQRNEFNQTIKQIISEENIFLADVGIEFNKYLQDKKSSDYCIDKFWSVTLFDRIARNTNKLSFKRNLFLTIDGVHLNNAGAAIYANCILKELKKN